LVLDFLPNGHLNDGVPSYKKQPIAQIIGLNYFVLLEVVPKPDVLLTIGETTYIGPEKRDKVGHILGKIKYSSLTKTAQSELKFAIEEIVKSNETKYIDFFNKSQPLSTRMHQLELLPGLGKKHMWEIIEEREIEKFTSFDDIKSRVKLIGDPVKMVCKRIIAEITKEQKHYLFVQKE
jgi:putative nucleotide binding protein